MKTILLAGLMIPALAQAMDLKTERDLSQKMSTVTATNGALIKMVDKKYVIDAVKKMHGDITVDLGQQGQVKVKNNPQGGGVLIGSGSDGLAVVSNQNVGGPVVLQPPMEADTSITVIGRPGSSLATDVRKQENLVCSLKIKTDNQGVIQAGASSEFRCAKLGVPLRLAEGKYAIFFSASFMMVDLKKNEKKIIPLREVMIPKQSSSIGYKISYDNLKVQRDLRNQILCAAITPLYEEYPYTPLTCAQLAQIPEEDLDKIDQVAEGKSAMDRGYIYWIMRETNVGAYLNGGKFIGSGYDGSFVSLFPGDYVASWIIDDQDGGITHFTVK
jgi:hypothetical protein